MEGVKVEIVLDRPNKTYSRGEMIRGRVVIQSNNTIKYAGVKIRLTGLLTMGDPKIEGSESRLKLIDFYNQIGGAGSASPHRHGEVDFEVELRELDRGEEKHLPETYKGVLIGVEYKLTAEVKLPGLLLGKTLSSSTEILVEKSPAESGRVGLRGRKKDFVLNHDTLFNRDPGSEAALRKAPVFDFRGRIDSDVVSILGKGPMLTGALIVGSACQAEVRSVELQLLRVESVFGIKKMKHTSEVQTIQVADGNVARGLEIPMRMVLPKKHFVCESVHLAGLFSIDFEVNVVVIFGKNFVVAENVPLTIVRHEIVSHC